MKTAAAVARFPLNRRGRDFVVGDLHGMFYLLERLLERVDFDFQRDRLFSVGDLCDRGPDSKQAPHYLDMPWFHACLGNHGKMLLDALQRGGGKDELLLWQMNGGAWGVGLDKQQRRRLVEAFSRLPLAMEIENTGAGHVGIVHAEVPPGMAWREFLSDLEADDVHTRNYALWARSRISQNAAGERVDSISGVDVIICGHTILPEPLRLGNSYYIDTGAFLEEKGRLSMVELNERLSLSQEPPP